MGTSAVRALAIVLTLMMLGSTACSYGPQIVTRTNVAEQITQRMTDAAGHKPKSVTCPDDLQPMVGATVTCTMTLGGKPQNVKVTVTGIDSDKAKLDMVVDEN